MVGGERLESQASGGSEDTHVKNGQKKVTHVRFEVGSFPEFKAQLQPPP